LTSKYQFIIDNLVLNLAQLAPRSWYTCTEACRRRHQCFFTNWCTIELS